MLYTKKENGTITEIEFTLTADRKSAIKKLFKQAFDVKTSYVTNKQIKSVFNFDLTKALSWLTILAECEEILEKREIEAEKPVKPLHETLADAIRNAGFFPTNLNSLAGISYNVVRVDANSKHCLTIGTLGYCKIQHRWFFGTRTRNFYFNTLDEAVKLMGTANKQAVAV